MLSPVVPKLAEDASELLQSPISGAASTRRCSTPRFSATRPDESHRQKERRRSHRSQQARRATPASSRRACLCTVADTISYDDFMKVDLRVATVVEAEIIEKANKLLRLTVDPLRDPTGHRRHPQGPRPRQARGQAGGGGGQPGPRKMKFGVSEGMIAAGPAPRHLPAGSRRRCHQRHAHQVGCAGVHHRCRATTPSSPRARAPHAHGRFGAAWPHAVTSVQKGSAAMSSIVRDSRAYGARPLDICATSNGMQ